MAQLTEFLGNHVGLTLALVVLISLIVWTYISPVNRKSFKLSPLDATRLINREDAVVLDVRGDGEFGQGHIINAINIPMTRLSDQLSKLDKYRARPIITACKTGHQSANACVTLKKHGFEKIYNLSGGMLAWEDAKLPVIKK